MTGSFSYFALYYRKTGWKHYKQEDFLMEKWKKRFIPPRKNAHYGCNNGSTEINNFGNDSEDEMLKFA